jgi:Flp pilus assembly protein TadG
MSLNFRRYSSTTRTTSRPVGKLNRFARRRDRGSMAVMCAVMIPILIGFGTVAVNQGYYAYRNLLLRQTVQSAALAAADKLSTYYSTGSTGTIVSTAQTFATANMPSATYGTVVPAANVVVGNWTNGAFISLASSQGTTPNAVQVTGINTAANSNPLALFFGSWFGKPTLDLSSTVVASFASGRSFNTIVVNDMTQSFSGAVSEQVQADQSILDCVKGQTGSSSNFGITFFNGAPTTYQPLVSAGGTNYPLLQLKIGLIGACSLLNLEDPNCSTGSNIAAGIYSAIQQFSGSAYTGTSKNIVIITDGAPDVHFLPNGQQYNYTAADGQTCGTSCAPSDLEIGAQTQAAAARAAGINISTIYYSGDDTNPTDQANNRAFLASLVTGNGIALVAPTTTQLATSYAGFCSTIPSSLRTAS